MTSPIRSDLAARAAALDTADPLHAMRHHFDLPSGVVYMNGNSLGPLPSSVPARLGATVAREWGEGLIRSWNEADWYDMPRKVGAKIAALLGAQPAQMIACDSVSVNIFKLAAAALKLRPGRRVLLTEKGNFPTDGYMLEGLAGLLGDRVDVRLVARDEILNHLNDDVALLLLTHVHYVTSAMFDMPGLTRAAHAAGALTLWDLSHSAGAVPVALDAAKADFAVGCGYKYLNGGPGAPAFAYVAERHLEALAQPLTGWFGHKTPFAFTDGYEPVGDIRKMLTGTTGVLGMSALDSALDVWASTDMTAVRAKSQSLAELFLEGLKDLLNHHNLTLASPVDTAQRGSHITLSHPDGYAVMQALIDHGVIGDFRAPSFMRFGFCPLYQSHRDILTALQTLTKILDGALYTDARYQTRAAVT